MELIGAFLEPLEVNLQVGGGLASRISVWGGLMTYRNGENKCE